MAQSFGWKLTDTDKTTLNGKPGMDSNGLKKGLLSVGAGAGTGALGGFKYSQRLGR